MPGTDSIVIKGLSPALGARVEGVDFRSPINPKIVEQIHVKMKYQVLVSKPVCFG